jgi:hypothetical protein
MTIAICLGYENAKGSIMYNIPTKELHRVFTGYVDTISYKLTNKQVLCVVACRDSIRFLVDNKINRVFTDKNLTTQGLDISGDRTRVIKDLVIQGCGVYDNGVAPLNTARIPLTQSTNFPDEPYWDPTDRPELGLTRPSDLKQGEAGLAEQATTHQLLNVMGKFPIEVIKHLSSIEGKPREFYSDRWGNIIWAIRKTNKLTQHWDFYFRNPIAIGNSSGTFPMISGSTEWSTVGTMTEFIVMNPTTGSGEVAGGAFAIQGTLKTRTALGFDMARRSRFIFDDTLDNSDTNISGLEAPFLAAMLSLHGKDVRAGSAEIEGLPQILPGDAVRVWGIGLYPPPHNLFRAEAIIHSYNGMGAKKGFRTNIMYAEIQESLESMTDRITKDDAVKAVTYNQTVAKPGAAVPPQGEKPTPTKPEATEDIELKINFNGLDQTKDWFFHITVDYVKAGIADVNPQLEAQAYEEAATARSIKVLALLTKLNLFTTVPTQNNSLNTITCKTTNRLTLIDLKATLTSHNIPLKAVTGVASNV